MKINARSLLLVPLLSACATAGHGSGAPRGDRGQLWTRAFDAYSRDSLHVAQTAFQRLATEYPRTHEGHEARYYLGVLSLDPRGPVNAQAAEEQLGMYLADDSARALQGIHRREAGTFLRLAHELRAPCSNRSPGVGCDTTVVRTQVPAAPAPATDAAEVARLRRQVTEQAATIKDLHAELERIRNTLAPRTPPG